MLLIESDDSTKGIELHERNNIKFDGLKKSVFKSPEHNMVSAELSQLWHECFTLEEKFELWFKHFNSRERARLWNTLVFSTEWIEKIYRSSRNDEHLGARKKVDGKSEEGFVRKDLKRMLN